MYGGTESLHFEPSLILGVKTQNKQKSYWTAYQIKAAGLACAPLSMEHWDL